MLSKRFRTRPLGQVGQESRMELQVEKALFKTNMRILSDMITTGRRPQFSNDLQYHSRMDPQQRRFLTRSERLHKVNDADYQSKFTTQIQERVVSADNTRLDTMRIFQYQTPICDRFYRKDRSKLRNAQCDVLGPYYCTDCIQIKKQTTNAKTHQKNFPHIEVHPRSLVAPDKVDRVLISREKLILNGNVTPGALLNTGYLQYSPTYNDNVYLPVLTENEVHERVRSSFRDRSVDTTPRTPRSPMNSFHSMKEISAVSSNLPPAAEMKVSVTFSNNTW